jgi:hypothetical protein
MVEMSSALSLLVVIILRYVSGQTYTASSTALGSVSPDRRNNGVKFYVQNTHTTSAIVISEVKGWTVVASTTVTFELWVKAGAQGGALTVSVANGWTKYITVTAVTD